MGSFSDQVGRFSAEAMGLAHATVRQSIEDAAERLIVRSPAPEKGNPYSTGRLISNWNYALMSPDRHVSAALNIRAVNYIDEIPKEAANFTHFISNGTAYGYYVEVGTSRMSAQPMVGPVTLEWPALVAEAARKVGA